MGVGPDLECDKGSVLSEAHNFRAGFTDKATERQKEPQGPVRRPGSEPCLLPHLCATWIDGLPTLGVPVPPEWWGEGEGAPHIFQAGCLGGQGHTGPGTSEGARRGRQVWAVTTGAAGGAVPGGNPVPQSCFYSYRFVVTILQISECPHGQVSTC